jgi:hypothetical protein
MKPVLNPDDWPEAALATLYRASISLGTQEQQLIWARYTGFLVLNGFFVSAYTASWGKHPPDGTCVLLAVGILGLVINAVWHILNFSGWQNQCLFFHQVANVSKRLSIFKLPTDIFRENVLRPGGLIYWSAQTVPTLLSLMSGVAIIYAADVLFLGSYCRFALALVAWPTVCILVLVIEYRYVARSAGNVTPV